MRVEHVERARAPEIDRRAMTAPGFAGLPGQIVLRVLTDGIAAQENIAVLVAPELACRRHDPAHPQGRADQLAVARACPSRADDLLQPDDVRLAGRKNGGGGLGPRAT